MKMCSYSCCDTTTSASMDLQDLSGLLKIVGEQNRLRLLCILRDGGEHCVCEFENHVKDLSQSLISHHLADLKQAGLVTAEKRGLKMHYSLTENGKRVTNIVFSLTQKKSEQCCAGDDCNDKTSNRKDNKNEDRSCGNGMCNVSATIRDNQASCC